MSNELTVSEAMKQLREIAATSSLGDETVLCVCIPGIEYQTVSAIKLERSDGGAIALIMQPFDLDQYEERLAKAPEEL